MTSTQEHGSIPAVAATFAVSGALMAQAYARMPTLRDQVGASSVQLGFALVGLGVGSVLAMPWTGRIVERWGSRRTVLVSAVVSVVGWTALGWVGSALALGLVMTVLGAGVGVWDVAMNVQGHTVERLRSRSLMPRLHGAFSGGTLLGALIGAGTAKIAVPLKAQLPVASLLAIAIIAVVVHRFVPDSAEHRDPGQRAARTRITAVELLIGLTTFSVALGEGAANDWLALLLVDVREAPEALGALTFAAFNLTMLVGRLAGGPAIERWGRVTVLRASGLCAAAGVLLVCLVPSLYAALAGGLLWGLGLATVFPATMSAAGELPGRGQRAIGVVSTIGYGGFLLGAPSIGLLSDRFSLDRALLIVAAFALLVVLLSRYAAPSAATSHTSADPDSGLLR